MIWIIRITSGSEDHEVDIHPTYFTDKGSAERVARTLMRGVLQERAKQFHILRTMDAWGRENPWPTPSGLPWSEWLLLRAGVRDRALEAGAPPVTDDDVATYMPEPFEPTFEIVGLNPDSGA